MTITRRILRAAAGLTVSMASVAALAMGGTSLQTAAAAPAAQDSPIYHSSDDWDWLATPGKVVPGGQYQNDTDGGTCSVGWIVSHEQRSFILTAGHCGNIGDKISISDSNGRRVQVGSFVESRYNGTGGVDDGLIQLWDNRYVDSSIPVQATLAGWKSAEWVRQNQPRICRIGYRTGYSCGDYLTQNSAVVEFRNIADKGDSGGPVFTVVDGKVYAIAVNSYGSRTDATRAGASMIDSPMTKWGLTIHS